MTQHGLVYCPSSVLLWLLGQWSLHAADEGAPRVEGRVYTFGIGNSEDGLVMYDHQTDTLWSG